MPYCAAFGCNNTTSAGKNKEKNVGFFSFPKSPVRRKAWIHAVRRKNYEPTKNATVCSDHFREEDFAVYPPKLLEMGFKEKLNWKLKCTAIPRKVTLASESNQFRDESSKPRPRGAFEKRRRKETILALEKESFVPECLPQEGPQEIDEVASTSTTAPVHLGYIVKSKFSQTKPALIDEENTKETQTEISGIDSIITVEPEQLNDPEKQLEDEEEKEDESDENSSDESSSSTSESTDEYSSDDYEPESDDDFWTDDEDEYMDDEESSLSYATQPHLQKKYIVYDSCIRELLSICNVCNSQAIVKLLKKSGSMVTFEAECGNNHRREWRSQPMLGKLAHGNMCLAACVLYSGQSPQKIALMFKHMNLLCFSVRTYYRIQHAYLIPSVFNVWKLEQAMVLNSCKVQGNKLTIGGDGRCDSPGHSAKYCSYTVLDLEKNVVLDTQLVQCNETTSSNAMELEGLKRCKETLDSNSIMIDALVTDRHGSVKKFMREKWQPVKHYFDVWHMAKGVNKKLVKESSKKNCEGVRDWIKSVVNHMYWVASSSGDNGQKKKEKWCSIMSHVCNIHTGFNGEFKQCEHGPIEDHREWIKQGTRQYKILADVVLSAYLLRDIPKLSPRLQTYGLEVFHSVLLGFAPKHTHYFYKAMCARIYMAALHFNENGNRMQATRKDGEKCWSVSYPKSMKGEKAVPSKVKVDPTYKYVEKLLNDVFKRRQEFPTFSEASQDAIINYAKAPPPVNATYQPYDKAELVKKKYTRFVQC